MTQKLHCTACQKSYPSDRIHPRCDVCNEPLELENVSRGSIKKGDSLKQTILERYADFFPFTSVDRTLSLGEGFTGLAESAALASELGVRKVYLKNETQNPTWSFKDRGTISGIQHALSRGIRRIGTVSTGNMAVSVAAFGARAGLETIILVSKGIAEEKLAPIGIHGPRLIRVDGDYGEMYFESLRIGSEKGIYFINSDVPLRVEGSKTIAFEICEQLDFEVPDYVVVPTSAGGNFRGILKGFEEFKLCGLIDRVPKMICAQAVGCRPIERAFSQNDENISRFDNPQTMAHAIENPYPPSGNEVLRRLRHNGGLAVAVTEEEIVLAQKRLAGEGLFGQPASAVPLAAVRKLSAQGVLKAGDRIALIVSGSGLKYTAALAKHRIDIEEILLDDLARNL